MNALPDSAVMAWWVTAWLRGEAVPDLVFDALGPGVRHVVVGLDPEMSAHGLLDLMLALRDAGADGLGLAMPVEGDPLGLGGDRTFNEAAMELGEACVATGAEIGVVPTRLADEVYWQVGHALPRQLPDLGEADRALRAVLLEVVDVLADLDVASWRPEVADSLMELRRPISLPAPPSTPALCVDLAGRAQRSLTIVELATEDGDGLPEVVDARVRREALVPLERAARRGLVAACSPECWPPTPPR